MVTKRNIPVLAAIVLFASVVFAGVEGSPHDLSPLEGGNPCLFCHTPHGALPQTPTWSHKLSEAVYTIYQSSSLEARLGQPTGASKLCLSCHDGTVALAHTSNGEPVGGYIEPGTKNLGTDLSDDHPISFVYGASLSTEDPQIRPPSSLPESLRLGRSSELQCTTCHDPHNNRYGDFLVMSNRQSEMCVSCHDLSGWNTSSHQSSIAATRAADDIYLQKSEFSTVSDNGCGCCHRPHSAGGHERLLHYRKSEDNCLNCHDGSVAGTNLRIDLNKASGHNVTRYDGAHDLRESAMTMPMHVECVDCHNPHATRESQSEAPLVQGAVREISGITSSGAFIKNVQYEYEICFKCHADNPNRIQSQISRQLTQSNTRLEFEPSNPSYHPVVSPGVNRDVPSLQSPLTVVSMIYCTDCHNSDSPSSAKGPHGSNYPNLLAYRYETSDFTQESSLSYELCYKKCHSRNSILNDESFPRHSEHLQQEAPCSACHDAHGISSSQGTATANSHLMNFDTSIVSADTVSGRLEFEDLGVFKGRCWLRCHETDHSPKEY